MKISALLPTTIIVLVSLSCSGKQNNAPTIPSKDTPTTTNGPQSDNRRIIWGLYDVLISGDLSRADITPLRTAGMHFNTVRLLEVTACTDCITIDNFRVYNPGEIALDVNLHHPFPGLIEYTGFDVRGILIAGADYTFPVAGRGIPFSKDKPSILNADGYTQLFNPTEYPESAPTPPIFEYIAGKKATGGDLSATLNPYLAYCEDQKRRMIPTTGTYTRTLRLRIPTSGGLEFGYAVDASWHPSGGPVIDPVQDFPPEANCKEAFKIDFQYGSGIVPGGGSASVVVDVFDHQGRDTIESVTLEAPLLFNGEIALSFSTAKTEDCFQYSGVIENSLLSFEDQIPVLVRVKDTEIDLNLGQIEAWTVALADTTPKAGWAVSWTTIEEGIVDADDMVCDDLGNFFVVGELALTPVDLDPGPSEDIHVPSDEIRRYLSKFDSNGQYLWGFSFEGYGYIFLHCDSLGNLYMIRSLKGEIDLDPGPGEEIYVSTTTAASCLTKLTPSGGYLWSAIWTDKESIYLGSVEVDPFDNVYVGGSFRKNADLDPGLGEDIHDSYASNAFICKLDSDGNF